MITDATLSYDDMKKMVKISNKRRGKNKCLIQI